MKWTEFSIDEMRSKVPLVAVIQSGARGAGQGWNVPDAPQYHDDNVYLVFEGRNLRIFGSAPLGVTIAMQRW